MNEKVKKILVSSKNAVFSEENVSTIGSTIACIILGILVGFIFLLGTNPADSFTVGLNGILFGGFKNFEKVLALATPILLTGLSVGFANKTGLFNIGASGQFLVGGIAGLYFALSLGQHWIICLFMSALFGFIYGAIPGLLKAFFNVNEVISSIMLNWVSLYCANVFVLNVPGMFKAAEYKTAIVTGISRLPRFDDAMAYTNIGILIGIIVAVVMLILINRTTFGYSIKATGFNREAARYGGISTKRNIVLSMAIAGALAGLGGGLMYLAGNLRYSPQTILVPAEGFNGIPVALLANNNPIGMIVTAIYISFLQVGSDYMQPEYTTEVVDLVVGCIIYFSAFALLIKKYFGFDYLKSGWNKFISLFKKKTKEAK